MIRVVLREIAWERKLSGLENDDIKKPQSSRPPQIGKACSRGLPVRATLNRARRGPTSPGSGKRDAGYRVAMLRI